ncbi:MAG: 5'/3'-nucleotidase SurE [Elusimicrobia bacterium]|nr:5'/3'-nucleotidase SurE [Elusimicrobiota bacterium]MDE2237692.1 5'/3'-nucleotidase SurE [Elusimicrobiota bacterium]MDE2425520.1 5'/3'-nucleotidase SurE [Elusimicrobiota bacterium]
MRRKPRILVCNDDGQHGPGLRPLISALRRLGEVTAVVPAQERSADSHSLTLHKPLRVHLIGPRFFTLNGKPADCARLGLLELMGGRADLVVSGINRGYNLGEDIVYSGTVAAAREATLLGLPALALSQDPESLDYRPAAAFAARTARLILSRGLPEGILLSANVPALSGSSKPPVAVTRLGRRLYSKEVTLRRDPRGGDYYWLAGSSVSSVFEPGTDVAAVSKGRISLTPLHIDVSDRPMIERLKSWPLG